MRRRQMALENDVRTGNVNPGAAEFEPGEINNMRKEMGLSPLPVNPSKKSIAAVTGFFEEDFLPKLRGEDKKIWFKVKRQWKKQFGAGGLLDPIAYKWKLFRDNKFAISDNVVLHGIQAMADH